MKPIMVDIFKLYDYVEAKLPEYYRAKNPNGKYGSITGVTTPKENRKAPTSKFYEKTLSHGSPNGFIYPILGSLRALLVEENGVYKWKCDPYKVLEKIGPELVFLTVDRSRNSGNDPVKVGKDAVNWQTLYMRVMFAAMGN